MTNETKASEQGPAAPERSMPRYRRSEIALEEEYRIAQSRGTVEAFELFIARHPDSQFADKARVELRKLRR